jgi:hypothetical protein
MAKYITDEIIFVLYTDRNKKEKITETYPFYYYISSNDDILPATSSKYMYDTILKFANKYAKSIGLTDATKFMNYLFPDKLIFRHNGRDIKTVDKVSNNAIRYDNIFTFSVNSPDTPKIYNYIESLSNTNSVDGNDILVIQDNIMKNKDELVKYLTSNINNNISGIKYNDLILKYSNIRYGHLDINDGKDKRVIFEIRSYELNKLNYIDINIGMPSDKDPYIQKLECNMYSYNIYHLYNLSSLYLPDIKEKFTNQQSINIISMMKIFLFGIFALILILAIKKYFKSAK